MRTPLTRSAVQQISVTRVEVRSTPPAARNAASNASGTFPLPPTGRPTLATWRIAWVRAPSPDPANSGEIPHTMGPVTAPGARTISLSKKDRSTSDALRRLQPSSAAVPANRRLSANRVSPVMEGGWLAASKTIRTAGIAALA